MDKKLLVDNITIKVIEILMKKCTMWTKEIKNPEQIDHFKGHHISAFWKSTLVFQHLHTNWYNCIQLYIQWYNYIQLVMSVANTPDNHKSKDFHKSYSSRFQFSRKTSDLVLMKAPKLPKKQPHQNQQHRLSWVQLLCGWKC